MLDFPYKDCILEGGQTKDDQKRTEIFYNEILAPEQVTNLLSPKAFCNAKRYDAKGEHKIDSISQNDNLIIKGNNLIALSSLLERYRGKVKCIYIDPPYNTGSDSFGYNDNFNHSTWLVFMKNRLELARKLLRDDGAIFVQIDNSPSSLRQSPEFGYLQVLLDEIFGRKNYLTVFTWRKKGNASNTADGIGTITESIFLYAKDIDTIGINLLEFKRKYNFEENGTPYNLEFPVKTNEGSYERKTMMFPIKTKEGIFYPPKGKRWTIGEETAKEIIKNNKYKIEDGKFKIIKTPEDYKNGEKKLFNNLLLENGSLKLAKEQLGNLGFPKESFDTPKPEELLSQLFEIITNENDLILDFHLGSGTTAAVAHKMGRQYIGVEQMDYIQTIAVERLKKVIAGEQGGISKAQGWQGGGSFVYCELASLNASYVKRIKSCKTEAEIISLIDEILKSDFVSSAVIPSKIDTNATDFKELSFDDKKRFALEILDKNLLYINEADMDDEGANYKTLEMSDRKFTRSFYGKDGAE